MISYSDDLKVKNIMEDFVFEKIDKIVDSLGCCTCPKCKSDIRYTVDRFGQLTIIGVMAMLLFHVFENVGMATGLMPITGIPLPFLSYGGSNLVTNMAGIGLVMNIVKNRNLTTSARFIPTAPMRRRPEPCANGRAKAHI